MPTIDGSIWVAGTQSAALVAGMAACAVVGAAILSRAAALGDDATTGRPVDDAALRTRRVEKIDPRAPPPPPRDADKRAE